MAIPIVLGAAARLIKSKGVREAAKKYGTKAIEKGKDQIAKAKTARQKAAEKTKSVRKAPSKKGRANELLGPRKSRTKRLNEGLNKSALGKAVSRKGQRGSDRDKGTRKPFTR